MPARISRRTGHTLSRTERGLSDPESLRNTAFV